VWRLAGDAGYGTILAVVLSVVPFGIAHLYQGWAGVLSTGMMGLCFALIFVRNRTNLWIPILAHGFANTVGVTVIFLDWSEKLRLW
jgi:membrane protease YdiL (CAAX protease family)